MTSCDVAVDPESRERGTWVGRLAVLKSRGVPDDDPRVVECRQALAYYRARRAIDAEAGQIAPGHLDALTARLREAVAQ